MNHKKEIDCREQNKCHLQKLQKYVLIWRTLLPKEQAVWSLAARSTTDPSCHLSLQRPSVCVCVRVCMSYDSRHVSTILTGQIALEGLPLGITHTHATLTHCSSLASKSHVCPLTNEEHSGWKWKSLCSVSHRKSGNARPMKYR